MIRYIVALLALFGFSQLAVASERHQAALADFDFVTSKVEANYAGWDDKTAGARRAELDALVAKLRADVADRGDVALRPALTAYTAWFADGHVQLYWSDPEIPWRAGKRAVSEADAKRLDSSPRRDPIEGIWTIDDRYRLVVLRQPRSAKGYDAVVLSSRAEGWAAGDIKAFLTTQADGSFAVRYGAGDRTEVSLTAKFASEGAVLDLSNEFGSWRRESAKDAASDQAEGALGMRQVDAQTLYLRIPSFNASNADAVRKLIADNADALKTTKSLIIDIRRNGGGSDFVYDPILPYVYTRPITKIGAEMRVSADNARLRRAIGERLKSASPDVSAYLAREADRMEKATTRFLPEEEGQFEIKRFGQILPNPARIAVLIDGAGSTAEQFILDARQSRKVVLMGQANSAGVLDYANTVNMPAPSKKFELSWATSRSLRLPADPVDPDGITPDIMIPKGDDPVVFATRWLARQAD